MSVYESGSVLLVDMMDLVRATELVSAAFEEAMREHGLLTSTRNKIGTQARIKIMELVAAGCPDPEHASGVWREHA